MRVLYEDNHCIAVLKPHGMLTQSDESGDPSLIEEVRAYLKETYHKPGNVFVGLVHRLDRPAGGVVVFAKTSKGASRLSEQFRDRRVEKIYQAVVEGHPKETRGVVRQWIRKNEKTHEITAFEKPTIGAAEAELSYKVLETHANRSLIEIRPKTGRPHQIRLAMRSLGTPILGDVKYGSKHPLEHRIALFACSLTFYKPVGEEPVTVTADPDWDDLLLPSL